ncbi:MAG: replicative helicase loader/inhibitor [Defluviitaleaceae bacterium]|nr:replicative helicase loader/inhibitor [Defluviitaleaceae bacterium]
MNRSDAIKLVGLIVTAYPNSDKFSDSNAVNNAVNLWAEFFEDDDVAIVALALKKHIATCKWPPQIAEIKEIMLEICVPDIIPPDEAWVVVALHLDNSGEYECLSEPERIFPLAIAKAIKAVGYRTLRDLRRRRYDHSGKKTGLDRVAFLQAYEPEHERVRKNAMLPASLQAAISHTQAALAGHERQLLQKTQSNLEVQEARRIENFRRMENANREQYLLDFHSNSPALTDGENGKVES